MRISKKTAQRIGNKLKVDWDVVSLDEFAKGIKVELEHKDVTKGNLTLTGKIALAHLYEIPDYYTRLAIMEEKK